MTLRLQLVLAAALLSCGAPVWAQRGTSPGMGGPGMMGPPPFGGPVFLKEVFPPKLVMEHQQEIGLKPSQVDAIKQAMNETQQRLLDIQWRLDAESEALDKLLAPDHVDEATVLAKLDRVTTIEQEVKKVNFALLIRIKNQLDPQQQAKLRALRSLQSPAGPTGPPPPPE